MLIPASSLEEFFDRWGSIAFLERSIVAGHQSMSDTWLSLFPRVETLKAFWSEAKSFSGGGSKSPMSALPTVCSMASQIVDEGSFAYTDAPGTAGVKEQVSEILEAAQASYETPDPSSFAYLVHDVCPDNRVWTSIPLEARSANTVRQCVLSGWLSRDRWATRIDGTFVVGLSAAGDWMKQPPAPRVILADMAAESPDIFKSDFIPSEEGTVARERHAG